MRRVVVTGLGTVNPLGNSVPEFSESLKAGRSGFGPITKFPTDGFPVKSAYEVKDAPGGGAWTKSKARALDPFIQYILIATEEAVRDSNLAWRSMDPYRIGISISSSKGGMSTIEKYGERFRKKPSALVAALCYASLPPNIAAQWVAKKFLVKGPAICYVAACATGLTAMIEGARMVGSGIVDCCYAGAGDASITRLMLAGYWRMGALSSGELRPFDKNRSGFALGEGAGVVVLEELEHAKARRAKIYGEILGTAYGTDVYQFTRFDPQGHTLSETLEKLLRTSGVAAGDVDYCHLHGTGTVDGDIYEAREVNRVFWNSPRHIRYSAIKSLTGHMLGASGACEFISVLLSFRDQYIPPVVSCADPDPACEIDLVRHEPLRKKMDIAVLHNMGFGGRTAALTLRRI